MLNEVKYLFIFLKDGTLFKFAVLLSAKGNGSE